MNRNTVKKSNTLKIVGVVFVIIVVGLFFLNSSKEPEAVKISTDEIAEKLLRFTNEVFDFRKSRGFGVNCDEQGRCQNLMLEKAEDLNFASESWKLEMFTSALKSVTLEPAHKNLKDRIDQLFETIKEKQEGRTLSDQIFTLAQAYERTGDVKFLKLFIIIVGVYAEGFEENNWAPDPMNGILPMSLVRVAQQLAELQHFLRTLPDEKFKEIKFTPGEKPLQDWYETFIPKKQKYVENLPKIIDAYLEGAEVLSVKAEDSVVTRSAPLISGGKESRLNADACWALYGYADSWRLTGDDRFLYSAKNIIDKGQLSGRSLGEFSIDTLQSVLPCLDAWKILASSNPLYRVNFERFLSEIISVYFDGSQHQQCLGAGVVLSFASTDTDGARRGICKGGGVLISDIAWMYSIIADQHLTMELRPVYVE